ncbi:malto-oligosyltrehalose synthase [Chitinasiproducens palmae]|uniref:Maltooligosyl trehalose synthase n=1 Tax=Chitinasiproducens palmae TaxID=1770053 RepID=A0A1H2PM59_9BURK|nr:malto-oligosyltrehalose synthase [Chitinasiproducens palmae]SDV47659.1 maltooligosyl trehalose synthase [Chitinasiproducens palmae]
MIHSTLRLQFHRDFTFDDALAHVDYFARLGVSHVYASPITRAEPGSTHGYDVVDYDCVNPELGGEDALRRFVAALRERGLGLIVDFVPNHMGVGGASNGWWLDVLEWGRHSDHARHFDIDWHSPDPALRGKMLAPFLGRPYGEVLAAGDLKLRYDEDDARFVIDYFTNRFPICPSDYAFILGNGAALAEHASAFERVGEQVDRAGAEQARQRLRAFARTDAGQQAVAHAVRAFDAGNREGGEQLHRLLERQCYRLAWWRTAADEVNWRRFFDISTLAGIKAERPEVFDDSHALILRLYREGLIDGIRLDHVDGLAEPREYCQRLRQRLDALHPQRPAELQALPPYVVIEKILGRGERLRGDWQVDGTTGYDFMNDVGALLHDRRGAAPLAALWQRISGRPAEFADEMLPAKRKILAENLSAELLRLTRALHKIARDDQATRDYSCTAIQRVLTELLVHFPVYRVYPVDGVRSDEDERYFAVAREGARQTLRRADHELLDVLDQWLGRADAAAGFASVAQRRAALGLFSQLTSPVAAKSVEDTACYRYGRLLSRNEVGADPDDFALSFEAFHAGNAERAARFPRAMLTTATHDHKRGEDVRARIAALSEVPAWWGARVNAWATMNAAVRRGAAAAGNAPGNAVGNASDNASGGTSSEARDPAGAPRTPDSWAPGAGPEAMLYQMLLGAWPLDLRADDADGVQRFAERIWAWFEKALREAKLETDWFAPNEDYEKASREFVFAILSPTRSAAFLASLAEAVAAIAPLGALNGLAQTVLRLTAPGVPDLYQGTEYWDESLVDPDNRRPVDYAQRDQTLDDRAPAAALANWHDARVKQAVVRRALQLRQLAPTLFVGGRYTPVPLGGAHADRALAFLRQHEGQAALVVVSLHAAPLLGLRDQADAATGPEALPRVPAQHWGDTAVVLPAQAGLAQGEWFDWFSDRTLVVRDGARLPLATLLDDFGFALLSNVRPH